MADVSKSLTWAFLMKPLGSQWAKVFRATAKAQPENARCLLARLHAPDFKSECRSALFEAINRELSASPDPLKHRKTPKV